MKPYSIALLMLFSAASAFAGNDLPEDIQVNDQIVQIIDAGCAISECYYSEAYKSYVLREYKLRRVCHGGGHIERECSTRCEGDSSIVDKCP